MSTLFKHWEGVELAINWSDEEKTLSLDPRAHGIESSEMRDFWTEDAMDTSRGSMAVKIQPHASYLGATRYANK